MGKGPEQGGFLGLHDGALPEDHTEAGGKFIQYIIPATSFKTLWWKKVKIGRFTSQEVIHNRL